MQIGAIIICTSLGTLQAVLGHPWLMLMDFVLMGINAAFLYFRITHYA